MFGPPIQNLPAKHSPATTSTDSHKVQVNNNVDYENLMHSMVICKYSNAHHFLHKNRSHRLKIVHRRKVAKKKRTKVNRVAQKMQILTKNQFPKSHRPKRKMNDVMISERTKVMEKIVTEAKKSHQSDRLVQSQRVEVQRDQHRRHHIELHQVIVIDMSPNLTINRVTLAKNRKKKNVISQKSAIEQRQLIIKKITKKLNSKRKHP